MSHKNISVTYTTKNNIFDNFKQKVLLPSVPFFSLPYIYIFLHLRIKVLLFNLQLRT